jgi:tetratricopeptide (TPR) repeat protein/SAM-dependent methyltransferase
MAKRRISKSEKRAQERKAKQQEEALLAFLRDYGSPESPQEAEGAVFDNQLKSISTLIATYIDKSAQGSILDVGCGNGVFLSRLVEISQFALTSWEYLGVDFPEYRDRIIQLAFNQNIHRRVDFLEIERFYKNASLSAPRPYVAFVRNVVHELNVHDTARLLETVARNLAPGEVLVIQDLQVFPKAEKGNACWIPAQLKKTIEACGFSALDAVEQSRSGSRWYNIIATRNQDEPLSVDQVQAKVSDARNEQWVQWRTLGAVHPDDEMFRDVRIAKIDFDLQFAALTNQLLEAGYPSIDPLTTAQQALVVKETFKRALTDFVVRIPADLREVIEDAPHFVDRGNSQDSLERYLASQYAITVIAGPTLMGKTELARHVLSKFRHGRLPILIDIQATASVWNLLESILSSMSCYVPNEVLAGMQGISFGNIRHVVSDFFETQGSELVIVFDHFERLLNPADSVSDHDIRDLLGILAQSTGVKVILTSRRPVNLSFMPANLLYPEPQPPVGRFPEGPSHVEQLLGTFIGLKDYPQVLIEAIDRHPMLAVLAGLYLRHAGKEAIDDESFLREIKNNMRSAVFSRIVDDRSRPAIVLISRLRVPAPRAMIRALSSEDSVRAAEELGLVFSQRDRNRDDLISCVGALRLRTGQGASLSWDDIGDSEQETPEDNAERDTQDQIATLYEQVYRQTDDPRWLREAFYHRMLVGDSGALSRFGVSLRSEIFGAGEYWFRYRKDFPSALWAFETAQRFGDHSVLARMRIASCLMRVKRQREGEEQFHKLLEEFPEALGVKTSYIDGLLYGREYERALAFLRDCGLSITNGAWIAGQFGRAFMGLQLHREAIEAFNQQLSLEEEPIVYQNLARAYHRLGSTDQERTTLERGLRLFPHSNRLQLSYAAVLERIGKVTDAARRLEDLLLRDPSNGWIIFPLVKALGRLGESDKAMQIWKAGQGKLHPELLRNPIQAAMAVDQGHYEEALSMMSRIPEDDEHSAGQKFEIYYAWAMSMSDGDARKEIARRGLTQLAGLLASNLGLNVPLMVSYAKLAIVAEDRPLYIEMEKKVLAMNPHITELNRLKAELKPAWLAGQ